MNERYIRELQETQEELKRSLESLRFSPMIDLVFKAIFTQDTQESEIARLDFLSSILREKVVKAEVLNTELAVTSMNEKRPRFDMRVKLDNQDEVSVEIQIEDDSNIAYRAEYYASKLYTSQEAKGVLYRDLHRVYEIIITNFTLFPERESFRDEYMYRNAEGQILTGQTRIIFLELTKLRHLLQKPAAELSGEEMWSLFLKYANNDRCQILLRQMEQERKGIAMANAILETISNDRSMQLEYIARVMHENDEINKALLRRQTAERAERAEQQLAQAEQQLELAEQRAEQAEQRAKQQLELLELAEQRAKQAEQRAEQQLEQAKTILFLLREEPERSEESLALAIGCEVEYVKYLKGILGIAVKQD